MNTIKTLLTTGTLMACFAYSSVQANGFFDADPVQPTQQKANTFDHDAHRGTAFWGEFDTQLSQKTPDPDRMASFDRTKHEGTTFWGEYYN